MEHITAAFGGIFTILPSGDHMKNKTKNIVLVGVMAAAMAAVSVWALPLPFGAPLTLQVFGAALSGYVLGAARGASCIGIYILLGILGVPVFAGFSGGAAHLASPTGGFIIGFLAVSGLCGLFCRSRPIFAISAGLFGLLICHLFGVVFYSLVTDAPLGPSFLAVSLPYILKDGVLTVLAYFASRPVKRAAFR